MKLPSQLEQFFELIKKSNESLKFEMVEIGAHPHSTQKERYGKNKFSK